MMRSDFLDQPDLNNPLWRLTNLYHIANENAEKQLFYHNAVQADIERKWTGKGIILKARQHGVSTYFLMRSLDRVLWNPNTWCCIIAHERQTLQILFNKIQFAWDNLNPEIKKILPDPNTDNKYEMFWRSINSKIYVALEVQGGTNHIVHFSEYALTDESCIKNTWPTIPPDGEVIIESRPNGMTNRFYKDYQDAKEHRSDFQAFFYPWWWSKKYRAPVRTVAKDNLLPEESALAEAYNLDHEQIEWRRNTVRAFTNPDGTCSFPEQYPEDDVSCFLSSGSNFFDTDTVNAIKHWVIKRQPPYLQGYITEVNRLPKFIENARGPLKIWEVPKKNEAYCLGCDSSENEGGGDWSAVEILKRSSRSQVAEYRIQTDLSAYADDVMLLGYFYNRAHICPERNSIGRTLLQILLDRYPLHLLYQEDEKIKVQKKGRGARYGYWTGTNTKRNLATLLQEFVRNDDGDLLSIELLDEMLTLKKTAVIKGIAGFEAKAAGLHDDLVMSWALALEMDRVLPAWRPPIEKLLADTWEQKFIEARMPTFRPVSWDAI